MNTSHPRLSMHEKCRVVLLVETTPDMLSRWPDIRQHYLPLLLDALHPDSDSDGDGLALAIITIRDEQPMESLDRHIFERFDSRKTQMDNLRRLEFQSTASEDAFWCAFKRGLDLLCDTDSEAVASKHIITAMTSFPEPPKGKGRRTRTSKLPVEAWEALAAPLIENQINASYILQPRRRSTSLDAFFNYTLDRQHQLPNPAWFQYNARKYQFFLSGFPIHDGKITKSSRRDRATSATFERRSASPASTIMKYDRNQSITASSSSTESTAESSSGGSGEASRGPRKPGLVNDLRIRFGFKPSSEDPPSMFRDPTPPLMVPSSLPRLDTQSIGLGPSTSNSQPLSLDSSFASPMGSMIAPSPIVGRGGTVDEPFGGAQRQQQSMISPLSANTSVNSPMSALPSYGSTSSPTVYFNHASMPPAVTSVPGPHYSYSPVQNIPPPILPPMAHPGLQYPAPLGNHHRSLYTPTEPTVPSNPFTFFAPVTVDPGGSGHINDLRSSYTTDSSRGAGRYPGPFTEQSVSSSRMTVDHHRSLRASGGASSLDGWDGRG